MSYWSKETFSFGNMGDIQLPPCDVLDKRQKDNLEALLGMSPKGILKTFKKLYKDAYDFITDDDNYLLCVPKQNASNLMLVAHVDVVGGVKFPKQLIWESPLVLRAEDSALGADDRAGIFVIVEAVQKAKKLPYILLTNYEETGGKGVKEFCKKEKLPEGVHFMVEFDRQGFGEYVVYSTNFPKELANMMGALGYEKKHGSYSDVSTLTDEFSIAHINLCVGYFGQHTKDETLVIPELMRTVETANILCATEFPTPFKIEKPVYKMYGNTKAHKCSKCGMATWMDTLLSDEGKILCWSCFREKPTVPAKKDNTLKLCTCCKEYALTSTFKTIDGLHMCGECSLFFDEPAQNKEEIYPKDDPRYDVRVVDGQALNFLTMPEKNKAAKWSAVCDCCGLVTNAINCRKILYKGKKVSPTEKVECLQCLTK